MAKVRKKTGCFGCLIRLILLGAVVWVLLMLAGNSLPMLFTEGSKEGLSVNENLPGTYANILLLGTDTGDADANGRTDTIIVASVNKSNGRIKLTSIMRDTIVNVPGYGKQKINTAYKFGGAELAMRTVNEAFGLNVTQYAVVDFRSFPYLVDALGGVNVTVTQEEYAPLNRLVLSMRHLFQNTGLDTGELAEAGENVRLTGLQALAYSRIRKIDSDYMRASRQRNVLNALLAKARRSRNPITLGKLALTIREHAKTNIGFAQMAALGIKVLAGGAQMEQFRLPVDGTFDSGTKDGTWSIRPNLESNRQKLYEFLYGSAG